jgi:hypothetical protein
MQVGYRNGPVGCEQLITATKRASTSSGSGGETLEEFDKLPDLDVLPQQIVVPRFASLGTTPSQG